MDEESSIKESRCSSGCALGVCCRSLLRIQLRPEMLKYHKKNPSSPAGNIRLMELYGFQWGRRYHAVPQSYYLKHQQLPVIPNHLNCQKNHRLSKGSWSLATSAPLTSPKAVKSARSAKPVARPLHRGRDGRDEASIKPLVKDLGFRV